MHADRNPSSQHPCAPLEMKQEIKYNFSEADVSFSVSNPVFSGSVSHVIPITIKNSCIVWCRPSVWAMADTLGKPKIMELSYYARKVISRSSPSSSCHGSSIGETICASCPPVPQIRLRYRHPLAGWPAVVLHYGTVPAIHRGVVTIAKINAIKHCEQFKGGVLLNYQDRYTPTAFPFFRSFFFFLFIFLTWW